MAVAAGAVVRHATVSPPKHARRLPVVELLEESAMRAAARVEAAETHERPRNLLAPLAFGAITDKNVAMLRKLNMHIFPVRYNDSFYGDVLFTPTGYSKFACWDGYIVGAICCRLEPMTDGSGRQRTYIMTLGVLEPYRHYKIGSALLQSVIRQSISDGVNHIYLHVQTNNEVALRFYRSFAFEVTETIPNYYKRIQPPDCFVVVKRLAAPAT